jgi:hypothetical protein
VRGIIRVPFGSLVDSDSGPPFLADAEIGMEDESGSHLGAKGIFGSRVCGIVFDAPVRGPRGLGSKQQYTLEVVALVGRRLPIAA